MSNANGRVWFQFRLRTALLAVLYLAILLSVFATWRATWRYEAAAWLRVRFGPKPWAFHADDTLDAVEPIRMAMLTEVLTSEAVMQRAADRLERQGFRGFAGAESRAGWVAEHVRSRIPGNDDLLVVRSAGPDPQSAVQFVDAVVDAYFEVLGEIARDHPDALLERLRSRTDPGICRDFERRFRGDPRWIIGPEAVSVLVAPSVADGESSWVVGPDTADVIVAPSVVRRVSNDMVLRVGIPLWLLLGLAWLLYATGGRVRPMLRRLRTKHRVQKDADVTEFVTNPTALQTPQRLAQPRYDDSRG